MALKSCTKSVDGTIPIPALLYDDEQLITSQEGTGIYEGNQKSWPHQSGTVHVTTHRLFYIDTLERFKHSFALDLSFVNRTDFYAGLFTSNPKVTLFLLPPGESLDRRTSNSDHPFDVWECQVCAYKNSPGLSSAAAKICGLCGVPRDTVSLQSSTSQTTLERASSLPPSSLPGSSDSTPAVDRPEVRKRRPSTLACPACTFLNHPYLKKCEICDSELPRISDLPNPIMKSAPSSRPESPSSGDEEDDAALQVIKVSFRKGGEKQFYTILKRTLQRKVWDNALPVRKSTPGLDVNGGVPDAVKSGISGILDNVESTVQGREINMKDALQDLEALRIKAQDMVQLAAELNEKLTAVSATHELETSIAEDMNARDPHVKVLNSTEPVEATFIRSSLSQLGLEMPDAPVTMDMMKDESKWMEELAKELAGVLQGLPKNGGVGGGGGGMMKDRGIVALDEVWGGWNRARGVALIPPSTFLQTLSILPKHTSPPIQTRKFSSGLTVLHTPMFSNRAFTARLCSFLVLTGPHTTMGIAQEEGLNIPMATMLLDSVEKSGDLVRDDVGMCSIVSTREGGGSVGLGEVEWYPNLFTGYVWDGEPL